MDFEKYLSLKFKIKKKYEILGTRLLTLRVPTSAIKRSFFNNYLQSAPFWNYNNS